MNEITNLTKCCTKCKETKPRSEFYRDYQRADKLNYKCKVCVRLYMAEPQRVARQSELLKVRRTDGEWRSRKKEYQRRWYHKKRMEALSERQ